MAIFVYVDREFSHESGDERILSSAVAKRPRDASCLYSFIQKVERSLLLLLVSASDRPIPLRTIKFFSVLFSSAYSSMLQAAFAGASPTVRSTLHGRR